MYFTTKLRQMVSHDIVNKYLMSNKEQGNYHPHYYAIQDKQNPELYWMIPISSQAEKYKGIIEKKKTIW